MNINILNLATTQIDIKALPGANNPDMAGTGELRLIMGLVFGVVGALSLLVITISGFRYVTSAGDPKQIAQAKDGILYAVIGLLVAISAEAIVAFVAGKL